MNSDELRKFKRDQPNVKLMKELADCVGRFVAMWITLAVVTYVFQRTGSYWFAGAMVLTAAALILYSMAAPMLAFTDWFIARQETPSRFYNVLMWVIAGLAVAMAISSMFAGDITDLMNEVLHSSAIPASQPHS